MALRTYSDFELMPYIGYLLLLGIGLPGHDKLWQGRISASFVMGSAGNVTLFFSWGLCCLNEGWFGFFPPCLRLWDFCNFNE